MKLFGRPTGPSGIRSGLRSGPRAPPVSREVSTYFFIEYHETTHGIKFLCQKFLWNRQKVQKKSMKPGHKKKKMRGFYLKPLFRKYDSVLIYCIFVQVLIRDHAFFFFVTWFHWFFWWFQWFHGYFWQEKLKPWVVSWNLTKK